jgi:hypothetical protein
MVVGEFLRGAAADRDPWNCSTMAADWCVMLGHPDFAEEWREVTDPEECTTIASYGLVDLWDIGIGDSLPVVSEPYRAGDIGVIEVLNLQAGAICVGDKWAIRNDRGMVFLSGAHLAVIKAWRP